MLALILAASALAVQDSGAFIVRLGNDTLSLEQYHRTATQLRGEYVIRTPRSLHRIYTADLNPDGSIRRFELITHNIGGGPGAAETKGSVEFTGDSAIATNPSGDSVVTTRVAVPKGTLPYTIHIYGLVEQYGRIARATGRDSVAITSLTGATTTTGGYVRKRGGDTLVLNFTQGQLAGVGPFTFRLDRVGRLVWLTGKGSTVQVDVERVPSIPMAAKTAAFASRPLGQLSVRDTARATVGGAEVWVDYSRPMKRGREIFGNVVPWNTPWRTGANAATQFSTSADLVIGGATVPAGKYTLWTLPTPTGWKLIINRLTGEWGTEYHAEQDLARVDAKLETLATPVDQFVIAFEQPTGNPQIVVDGQPVAATTVMTFTWDKTKVLVPVSKK